jgi:hypothetical protein
MQTIVMLSDGYSECHIQALYAEGHYAESHAENRGAVMLSAVILNFVILSVQFGSGASWYTVPL